MTNDDRPVAELAQEKLAEHDMRGHDERDCDICIHLTVASLDWLRALLGERDALVKERLEILIGAGELTVERDALRSELDTLKASILDLSHPNCQMLLRDANALRRRVTELEQQRESAFRAGYACGSADERINCDFSWRLYASPAKT